MVLYFASLPCFSFVFSSFKTLKLGRGGEQEKHRENGEKMVGLHQEQAEDDPLAEEERRRRRDAVLDKLPDR